MTTARIALIRAALEEQLAPTKLDIVDESHLHRGHAGAKSGKGHFRVTIVAERFAGLTLLKRHRLVFAALGELMTTDIHALSIDAGAPEEASPGTS